MPQYIEDLKQMWSSMRVPFRAGASVEAIRSFEARHGIALPTDLRVYFLSVNGMEDGVFDENMSAFLPIEEVACARELFSQWPTFGRVAGHAECFDRCFVFVDCVLSSHFYAFRLSEIHREDSPIYEINDFKISNNSNSFKEFIERYTSNPAAL